MTFTPSSDQQLAFMHRALELARRGIALCSPNPAVGCVILDRNGELAGEGWHEYDLRDHAEVVALRNAGECARGGTAFVTLEPCNHTGRTGPCSEALVQAGIARVIVATEDPNPLVAGQGIETLRRAGVHVEVGLCRQEAQHLNEAFAKWIVTQSPFVSMKVAMTLDGRIAPASGAPSNTRPYWITGEAARQAVHRLRWESDAILTGVDTVIADDPLLTDRSGLQRRRPLLRIVLDSALRIPIDSKLIMTASDDVVVFTACQDSDRTEKLIARGVRVEIVDAVAGRISLHAVLEKLGAEDILTVLTETGTRLNTALLVSGLVDRLTIFMSPQLMGSDAVPAFRSLSLPVSLDAAEVQRFGNDLCFSSLLRNPWPAIR